MKRRVHYPINKDKIAEAIDYYNQYNLTAYGSEDADHLWNKFNDAWNEVCPYSNVWASHIFQAMRWSGTLTVDRVYYTILASGINTVLEEVD